MKQVQKGFTLIELMIVVAIIGILAAVAIPAYQDYVVKAKLSKVQSTLDSVKTALAMYYQENGAFPTSATTVVAGTNAGIPIPAADVTAGTEGWASIGLTNYPVLPSEVKSLAYISTGASLAIVMTMDKIKATTIDNQTITISPTAGTTAAGVLVAPVAATGAGMVQGTAIQWKYACDPAKLDAIARKYFNNAGVECAATTP